MVSSNSSLKSMSMEETNVSSSGSARENPCRGDNGLPPPLGFSAMIQSSPQLVPISSQGILGRLVSFGHDMPIELKRREMDAVNYGKSFVEWIGEKNTGEAVYGLLDSLMNLGHVDILNSSTKMSCGDSSNSESETVSRLYGERVKRSAAGDIAPEFRHSRSLSMDSGIGKFRISDSLPDQLSPSNSLNENSAKISSSDFPPGEFNEVELKKIMGDGRLAEIAVSDPKRAKRILANRQSAARSKERKLRYISELEHKVQTLQSEVTMLSAQITTLQKDHAELNNQNNELKFRIRAVEQQGQLRDARHDTLTAEVQCLKLANMQLREEGRTSNGIAQQVHMKHPIFPMQRLQQATQIHQLSVATSTTSTTASAAPVSA